MHINIQASEATLLHFLNYTFQKIVSQSSIEKDKDLLEVKKSLTLNL